MAEDNAMVLAGASSAAQVTLASPAGISDGSTGTLAVSGLLTLSAGASDIVLDNANDFAQIAFTGNHVTLNDTAAGLSFAASSASGNLIVTATGALTQSGPLTVTGTTSLTVGSANNITLNNPGNDFGGAVSIVSANAVSLTDQNALILGASTISGTLAVTAGGTLTDAGAVTVAGLATLSASGQSILLDEPGTDFTSVLLTAASAELRDTAGGLIHAGGNVSGALLLLTTGGLTQTAAVTAGSLGVRNTGTGAIDLSTSSNAIGTFAAANTVSGGAILVQFDASTRSIGTVSAGTLFPATAGLTTANGPITVSSGTTLNLGANLTSTGGGITFTTQAASLTLTANVTLDSAGGSIQVNRPINSATLDTHTLTLTAGAGNIQLGNVGASTRPLGVLVTSANNVSGTAISVGSGGITQASGTGTTTFSGLLRAFNGGSISLTGTAFSLHSLQVASAGTIDIAHAGASSLTVSNTTTLGASGVLTVNATTAATTGSIAGTITGTGAAALVKVGPGTLTLSGNNTYLGQTSINAGVLTISSATALGTTASPTVVASGAALALDPTASITVAEPIRLNGIGVSGIGALVNLGQNNFLTGGVTLLASSAIGVSGGTLTVQTTGVTDGAGSFTLSKVGAGTLRISAPGTYDGGSTISAGTLALGASDVLPAGTVTVDATLDLAGFAEGITLLAGSGIITTSAGPATLTVDAGSFAGTIQNTVALTKATSGTLVLSGANTYTGATSIQAGLLRAGASNTFSTDSAVSLANVAGATLDLDGFNNTIPSLAGGGATGGQVTLGGALLTIDGSDFTTFAGTISGNGQLTVSGTTTLELTSANNYTGTTTIHAGATLVVSGSITSPVSHAGILAGSGSITGDVASTGAGAVLPGNGIGVLTVTGNFAASTTFEIAAPYLLAGTDYDRLVVQGATNTINLSAATVSFTSVGGGTAPVLPTFLTLIVNDTTNPIVPFSNLPEGGLVTLGLGGAARTFIASYLGGDGNDLVLYNADAPSTVYVRSSFTGGFGQLIADADLGTTGAQPALVGLTAFATLADALAAVALNGTVVVNAGTYPENVTLTGASRTLRIGGPDAPQSVTVQALTVSAAESLALAGASSLTFGTASSTSIAGTLAGTGTLIKQGAGVVSLSGSNTAFTGKIQLLGGALSISDDANLGAVPDSLVADLLTIDGGTLLFTGSADITLAATRGITLGSGGATLDSSALATNLNAILQGPLSGAGDLTLVSHGSTADQGAPAGSLRLASLASSFLGTVTVSAGVVSFAGDASFGDATNPIHLGTTAARAGLFATSSVSLPASRSIILVGGGERVLRTLAGATFTVASTLSGAGPLILTDAGTLALAGSNSYTGYTYLAGGGTLQLAASDVVPDGSDVLQGPGSTFDLAGQTEVVRGIFVTSAADTTPTLQLGTGGSLTLLANTFAAGSTPTNAGASYSARIRGAGSITYAHATSDTVAWDILNPANDFVGTWTVTRGRLRFGSDGAVGDADNDIVLNGAPVIGFTDQTGTASLQPAQAGPFTLGPGHALVLPAGKQGTLLAFGSDTLIVQGNLTGAGQLRKEGVGAVELHGSASTYAGDTIIVAGTLRAGGTNTLSPSSSVVLNPTTPATLDLAGFDNTIHLLSGGGGTNGNVLLGAGTLTTGGNGDSTYAGILSGTGGLIKRGAGTLILTGASTYTGPTTVRAGTLQLGDAGTTGSLNAASTVTLGDAATGASPVTFLVHRSDASTHANPIVVSSLGSGTATVGTLDTTGGGTSTTFTGSVTLHRSTSFLSLDLDGQVFSNSITGSVGTLTVTGGGRTILQASNSFVGNVAVTGAGTILRLASTGDQIPNASSVDLAAGTLLELHGDGETINALTGSGSVQNSSGSNNLSVGAADGAGTFQGNLNDGAGLLAFVKLGTGTQILAGAGNATGGVTVSGGTLRLEGARSLDEGYFPGIDGVVYTVQTGATLTLAGDWISRSSSIYRIHGGELQTLAPGGDLLYLNQVEFDVAPGLLSGTSGFRTGRFANPVFQVTAAASGSVITAPVSLDDSPTTTHLALDVADGAASDDLLISSVISDVSGAAGLAVHKLGAGLLRLTGSSTYTGATRFEAGIVAVPTLAPAGSPSPLGATAGTSDLLVFNGGVLRYTGTSVSGINRTFTILAGGGTLDVTQPGTTLELSDASGVGASTGTGGGLLTLTGAGSGTLNQVLDAGLTGGLTKTGNGTWTLGRTNLYTGLTTISTGRLHVDGSIIGNVTIASGAFLGGSGTVGGSVSGAGSIAPGSSPGILTVGALASVGSVVVELNGLTVGTQYDQLQVNGAVNLTGTTLTLALGIAPTVGQQFTVLARNAVGPITGTFVGLAEGATFTVSSTTFQITYQGGDGNDVVLTVVAPAAPTLQGTPGDDTWLVIRNGAHLEVHLNGNLVYSALYASITGGLTIDGLDGSDSLTVDFLQGNAIPAGNIAFEGGSGASDTLTLTHGTTATVTHTFLSPSSGSVTLAGALTGVVSYTGLEPVFDYLVAAGRIFDFLGAAETITLTDSGAADGQMTIDSTLGEAVTFANPTTTLTLQTGNGSGVDALDLDGFDSALGASLVVTAPDDSVSFHAAFTFAAGRTVTVDADAISIDAAIATTGSGSIDLEATTVTVLATGSLTTASGSLQVQANQVTLIAGSALSAAASITLQADSLAVAGTVTAPGQRVLVQPRTSGTLIDLGGSDVVGTLGLTDAELDRFQAGVLQIGSATAGAITLSAAISPANTASLHLMTASTVGANASGALATTALAITAPSGVALDVSSNAVGTLAILSAGAVAFRADSGLTVGTVDGVAGLHGSSVSLTVPSGLLTVQDTAATHDVESTSGSITLTADAMALQGSITTLAGGQSVTLRPFTAGQAITLGSDVSGTLSLDDIEIDHISTARLEIGSASAGAITVTAAIDVTDAPTIATLRLNSGAGVTASAAGITAQGLAIAATGAVSFTAGSTDVATLAIQTSGAVTFVDATGLTIGTVDGLHGVSGSSVALTAMAGSLTVQNTAASPDVLATAGALSLRADDIDLQGTLSAGSQTVTLVPLTSGRGITLGGEVGGTLSLTDAELDAITAGRLIVGDASTGALSVVADINLTDGPVIPVLRLNAASVTATTGGVIVASLALQTGAVTVTTSSTNVGTVAISATGAIDFHDADTLTLGTVDGLAGVDSSSVVAITSAGLLTLGSGAGEDLQAATADLHAAGLTQLAGSIVNAAQLRLRGTGLFTLNQPNTVGTLAASINGALTYQDVDALTIGTVVGTAGISTSDDAVTLTTGGLLTLGSGAGEDVSLGNATLDLFTAGATQASGSIVSATALRLRGTGVYALTQGNLVDVLACQFVGSLDFANLQSLTVGTVLGTVGITSGTAITNGGSVVISCPAQIVVDASIDTSAGTGGTTSISGDVVVNAFLTPGAGDIILNGATGTNVDLIIDVPLSSSTDIILSAPRDIIVRAPMSTTTGSGASIFLTAGTSYIGPRAGGIWVDATNGYTGSLNSDGAIVLRGKDLQATFTPTTDAIRLEGTVTANTGITFHTGTNAPAGAGTYLGTSVLNTGAGDITFNHAVLLTASASVTASNGNVHFNGPLDGAQNLTLDAPAGTITFAAAVGGTTSVGSGVGSALTLQAGSVEFQGTVRVASGIQASAGVPVVFRQDVEVGPGNTASSFGAGVTLDGLSYRSAVGSTFSSALNLSGGAVEVITTAGAAWSVQGPLQGGGQDLTLNVAGPASFQGAASNLGDGTGAALTIQGAGTTTFHSTLQTSSGIRQTAGAGEVIFRGDVTISGAGDTASDFAESVTLGGLLFTSNQDVTFGSSASDLLRLADSDVRITLSGGKNLVVLATVSGDRDLTLDVSGSTRFAAPVGSPMPLGDGTGHALTLIGAGATTFESTLTVNSGLDQDALAGRVTFQADVTVQNGSSDNFFNGNVTLDGLTFLTARNITFGDAASDSVTLSGAAVTLQTSLAGRSLLFRSQLTGDQNLVLTVPTGTVSVLHASNNHTGATTLNAPGTTMTLASGAAFLDVAGAATAGEVILDAANLLLQGPGAIYRQVRLTDSADGSQLRQLVVANAGGTGVQIDPGTQAVQIGATGAGVLVQNSLVGLNLGDDLDPPTRAILPTSATIAASSFLDNSLTGVRVANATLTVAPNNLISAATGTNGLVLTGPSALISSLSLGNLSLQGYSGAGESYIRLEQQALAGPRNLDASAVRFDGLTGASMSAAGLANLEKNLVHYPDDAGVGLIVLRSNYVVLDDGNLLIVGSDQINNIRVDTVVRTDVKVSLNSVLVSNPLDPLGRWDVSAPGKRVIIFAQGGDDAVQVTGSLSSEQHGGLGNDRLTGGAGTDILDGEAGIDTLVGMDGHDVLIGGLGRDTLQAGNGNDLLIGGQINPIAEQAAYAYLRDTALAGWLASPSQAVLDALWATGSLDGTSINEYDVLSGGLGTDGFIAHYSGAGILDLLSDFTLAQGDKRKNV
ncbi:MAG: autotransporter-associated beta strand repeat-containing protein [Gemmataceae bacterium]